MIINPIVAAAAVAARAVGFILPGDWTARRPSQHTRRQEPPYIEVFPFNPYFVDMEDDMHQQSKDLKDFIGPPPISVQDAEILTKETTEAQAQDGSTNPPPLPTTNNPLRLLGLEPGADFDSIRRAYKEMAKIYHPDVVVGPDASPEERKEASWGFARINSAFDILKRREEEEVFEYSVYVDGERVTRSVTVSEESRQNDPYRISYERIRQQAEYRKHRPKKRMWYEADHDYQPGYNGFGDNEPYSVSAHSKGNWRVMKNYDQHSVNFSPRDNGFGPIPSHEQLWEERHNVEKVQAKRNIGFGVNPHQDQWWNERSAFDYEGPSHNHQHRNNQMLDNERKQGYPYKDSRWNDRTSFDEDPYRPAYHDFDYDPRDRFPVKEKWWKEGDPSPFDGFAP